MAKPSDGLIPRAQACERLGIGNPGLQYYLSIGRLRSVRLGATTYVEADAVEKLRTQRAARITKLVASLSPEQPTAA